MSTDYQKFLETERDSMRTKWEILQSRMQKAHDEYRDILHEMNGLKGTSSPVVSCHTCGVALETEADFAKHYLIPDERYLNLGNCPSRYNNGVRMPPLHGVWGGKGAWEEAHEANKIYDEMSENALEPMPNREVN